MTELLKTKHHFKPVQFLHNIKPKAMEERIIFHIRVWRLCIGFKELDLKRANQPKAIEEINKKLIEDRIQLSKFEDMYNWLLNYKKKSPSKSFRIWLIDSGYELDFLQKYILE